MSCESGMHIASFQDGTDPLPDLEYAKGMVTFHLTKTYHGYTNPNEFIALKPLATRSDQHATSSYNIHILSSKQVMRILKLIR